jgi:hypothetical protein
MGDHSTGLFDSPISRTSAEMVKVLKDPAGPVWRRLFKKIRFANTGLIRTGEPRRFEVVSGRGHFGIPEGMAHMKNAKSAKSAAWLAGLLFLGAAVAPSRADTILNTGGPTQIYAATEGGTTPAIPAPTATFGNASGTLIATSPDSMATTGYDLTPSDFHQTFNLGAGADFEDSASSTVDVFFSVTQATAYSVAGSMAVTDVDGGSNYASFTASLFDLTQGIYLYNYSQLSDGSSNPNYTLDSSGGNLTGTLTANDNYQWDVVGNLIDLNSAIGASGGSDLSIGASPLPLPAAGPAAIVCLAVAAAGRGIHLRRSRLR